MTKEMTWKEFRESGLLWFINSILHLFGCSIVLEIDTETGKVTDVYPARTSWRGFKEVNNTEGYLKVTNYLKDNIEELIHDQKEGKSND